MSFVVLAVLPQLLEAKDHVGHCCRYKLVQNLLLKVYQSLTNFQRNIIGFSKTTKLLSLLMIGHTRNEEGQLSLLVVVVSTYLVTFSDF